MSPEEAQSRRRCAMPVRALLCVVCGWLLAGGMANGQTPVYLNITNAPAAAIPNDFIGMSFEIGTLLGGSFFSATNRPLITLFQNLGVHNLRMGGGTSDGPSASIPDQSDVSNLFAFVQAVGDLGVIYSMQLHNGNSAADAAMAQFIQTNYQSELAQFALGNEPDWSSAQSQDPTITNFASYLSAWNNFAAAITAVAPAATFAGPDTGNDADSGPPDNGNGTFANNGTQWTTDFASDELAPGLVTMITQHEYVADGSTIGTPTQYTAAMLSQGWDTVTNQILYNVMGAPVLAEGCPFRLTEAEDCVGGVPGASDTFAGALWALDFLQWWAAHGCAGVNFHNSRWKTNTVLTVNNNPSGALSVYPKGYGVKAFDVGGHGNTQPVGLVNSNSVNLTAYAVSDSTNLYVTIINREYGPTGRNASVTISLDGFMSGGSVAAMYLLSSGGNVNATNGITLGGAIITNNAPWSGQWTNLGTVSNGVFTLTVDACSAAVVRMSAALGAPVLTKNLPNQVVLVGGKTYTYSVSVNAALPFGCQWYAGAAPLAGQTNTTYAFTAGNPGVFNYFVVVSNAYGAATSAVSTLTIVPPLTDVYGTGVLKYGPVGYWPLQETNAPAPVTMETNYGTLGTAGNAYYAATAPGVVEFGVAGALAGSPDTCVAFSGSSSNPNSYAFVPRVSPGLTIRAPFTLEAWVNPANSTYGLTIGEGGGTGLNGGATFGGWQMGLGAVSGNNRFQMQYYTGSGSAANNGVAGFNYTAGQWYHYVITYDGNSSTFYIDGTNIFTATTANAPDTWSPLAIGAGKWDFGPIGGIRWLQGDEDEVAVYTNLLTSNQINGHYLAGISTGSNYFQTVQSASPLLYYRMDCLGYTNPAAAFCPAAVNYGTSPVSGYYQPGVVPGGLAGPPIADAGTNSLAAQMNGVFSCVDAGSDPGFNPTGSRPFTAITWFRTYPADGRMQTMMSHGGNTSWALNLVGTSGTVTWSSGAGSVASTNILNDGNWHFAAGVYDGVDNYLYVDGVLNNFAIASGSVTGNTNDDIYLGGDPDYMAVGSNQRYFAGAIAQAAFFTNALTAGQIQQIYGLSQIPMVSVSRGADGSAVIVFTGTLQSATSAAGPYAPVNGAVSPYTIPPGITGLFYRASNP